MNIADSPQTIVQLVPVPACHLKGEAAYRIANLLCTRLVQPCVPSKVGNSHGCWVVRPESRCSDSGWVSSIEPVPIRRLCRRAGRYEKECNSRELFVHDRLSSVVVRNRGNCQRFADACRRPDFAGWRVTTRRPGAAISQSKLSCERHDPIHHRHPLSTHERQLYVCLPMSTARQTSRPHYASVNISLVAR
jgi:hypothetical protein